MGEKDGQYYWPSTCNRSEEPDRSLFGISGSTHLTFAKEHIGSLFLSCFVF